MLEAGPRSSARSGSRSGPRPSAPLLACALGLPGGARAAPARASRAGPGSARSSWCPSCCPPSSSASPSSCVIGRGGPLGRLGLDGSPVAIVAGLVFFNASVVIRVVGGAWESLDPRPAEAAAALGASPWQVLRDVTFPALRPALVSAATVVFLFCATAFGIVLTLGGLRYSSVETQIYLLTTHLLDLQAAAALSVLQLVVVTGLLVAAARARRTPDATVARTHVRLRRPGLGDLPALAATALLVVLVALPLASLVVQSLRVDGAWSLANYRALQTPGSHQALLVPVTTALVNSLRIAVDATWMSLLLGLSARDDRDPSLAHPLRAPAPVGARRAVHAAARGLGGDPRLRLPDHPRPPAARPARLAAADPGRPGPGGPAAGGADPGAGAGAASTTGCARPPPPSAPRPCARSPSSTCRSSGSRCWPRPASRSPARWGSSAPRRSWSATTGRPCRS